MDRDLLWCLPSSGRSFAESLSRIFVLGNNAVENDAICSLNPEV
ncbi:hypothetical protein CIPAW_03G193800 [Carya illinoinensis]|uniref:Uncharacterized protein n=1 Tax=Carya illinoinensis TaxID=32201 RepID=A0A8T1R468_CARIL|nr:hypothetical protein CIPAW_03G193800 [Carya illinoinensis]